MRPFPLLAALISAAVLTGTVVDPEHWLGDKVPLVLVAYLAAALVGLSWWELWSTRDD